MKVKDIVELYKACIDPETRRIVEYRKAVQSRSEVLSGKIRIFSGEEFGPDFNLSNGDHIRGSRTLAIIMLVLYKEITNAKFEEKKEILKNIEQNEINDREIMDFVDDNPEAIAQAYLDLRSMRECFMEELPDVVAAVEAISKDATKDKCNIVAKGRGDIMVPPAESTSVLLGVKSLGLDNAKLLKENFDFINTKAAIEIKAPFLVDSTDKKAKRSGELVAEEIDKKINEMRANIATQKKDAKGVSKALEIAEQNAKKLLEGPSFTSTDAQTAGLEAINEIKKNYSFVRNVNKAMQVAVTVAASCTSLSKENQAKVRDAAIRIAVGEASLEVAVMAADILKLKITNISVGPDANAQTEALISAIAEISIANRSNKDIEKVKGALEKSIGVIIGEIAKGKKPEVLKIAGVAAAAEFLRNPNDNEIAIKAAVNGAISAFEAQKADNFINDIAEKSAKAAKSFQKTIQNAIEDAANAAKLAGNDVSAAQAAAEAKFGSIELACLAASKAVVSAMMNGRLDTAEIEGVASGNNAHYNKEDCIKAAIEVARIYPNDIELQNEAARFASTLSGSNLVEIAMAKAIVNKTFPGNEQAMEAGEKAALDAFGNGRGDTAIDEAAIAASVAVNQSGDRFAEEAALHVIQTYRKDPNRIVMAEMAAGIAKEAVSAADGFVAGDIMLGVSVSVNKKRLGLDNNLKILKQRKEQFDNLNKKYLDLDRKAKVLKDQFGEITAGRLKKPNGAGFLKSEIEEKKLGLVKVEKERDVVKFELEKSKINVVKSEKNVEKLEKEFEDFVKGELKTNITEGVAVQKKSVSDGVGSDIATLQAIITIMAKTGYKPPKHIDNILEVSKMIAEKFVGKPDPYKNIDAILKVASEKKNDPNAMLYTKAAMFAALEHAPVHDLDNKAVDLSKEIVEFNIKEFSGFSSGLSDVERDNIILESVKIAAKSLDKNLTKDMFVSSQLSTNIKDRTLTDAERERETRANDSIKLCTEAAKAGSQAVIDHREYSDKIKESAGALASEVVYSLEEKTYSKEAGVVAGRVILLVNEKKLPDGNSFSEKSILELARLGAKTAIIQARTKKDLASDSDVGNAINPVNLGEKAVLNVIDIMVDPTLSASSFRSLSPSSSLSYGSSSSSSSSLSATPTHGVTAGTLAGGIVGLTHNPATEIVVEKQEFERRAEILRQFETKIKEQDGILRESQHKIEEKSKQLEESNKKVEESKQQIQKLEQELSSASADSTAITKENAKKKKDRRNW